MARTSPQPQWPEHQKVWEDSRWRSRLRRQLIAWFNHYKRDLPWRGTDDPYAVWISEIMLQQTQVVTVIPYFQRFLQRFPDVRSLAGAAEEEVLRHWEGLGYYRRAKQMHAAARVIVESHGGVFPDRVADVLALPGIGRYTAGAVLSISGDQRLPIVEANTVRLYSRLIALRRPPAEAASMRLLWEVAEQLLPDRHCGRFNSAAMELGALVCTPREPRCDQCPLRRLCPTRELGLQHEIPGRVKKMVYEPQEHWAVVAAREDRFFLRLCPPGTHWAGLWDFPRFDVTGREQPAEYVAEQFRQQFGWSIRWGDSLRRIRHGVTRFRITLHAHRATPLDHDVERADKTCGWFSSDQIVRMPLNTTGRKLRAAGGIEA